MGACCENPKDIKETAISSIFENLTIYNAEVNEVFKDVNTILHLPCQSLESIHDIILFKYMVFSKETVQLGSLQSKLHRLVKKMMKGHDSEIMFVLLLPFFKQIGDEHLPLLLKRLRLDVQLKPNSQDYLLFYLNYLTKEINDILREAEFIDFFQYRTFSEEIFSTNRVSELAKRIRKSITYKEISTWKEELIINKYSDLKYISNFVQLRNIFYEF